MVGACKLSKRSWQTPGGEAPGRQGQAASLLEQGGVIKPIGDHELSQVSNDFAAGRHLQGGQPVSTVWESALAFCILSHITCIWNESCQALISPPCVILASTRHCMQAHLMRVDGNLIESKAACLRSMP